MLWAEAAARAGDAEGAAAGSAARPGAAAGPGRPACAAGDWRRAFALPLCKLHARPGRPAIAFAPTADVRRMAGAATAIADAGAGEK
ncbi:g8627 [Coccomyxa elongata]